MFETISYSPKWGLVSCFRPLSPSYTPWKTTQLAPSALKGVWNRQFSEGRVEMSWAQGSSCEDIGLQEWKKCVHFTFLIYKSHEIWLLIVLKNWWAIRCLRSPCRLLSSEVPSVYYQIVINNSLCKAIIGIRLLQSVEFETYPFGSDYLVSVTLRSKSI